MPNRSENSDQYRYGFNGQEKDDELKGQGNSINYKFRMHDPRIGRFFAVDPLASKYPHNSPYAFSENRVIDAWEIEGLENIKINYSSLTMQDLMRINATNEGSTKIKAINNPTLQRFAAQGSYTINRVFLARSSEYVPSTNTINYGINGTWFLNMVEKASFESYVILGHEISHGYDELYEQNGVRLNKDNYTKVGKIPTETAAVHFGNYLRSVYGSDWYREEYHGLFDDLNSDYTNSSNEKITDFTLLSGWETISNDLGDVSFLNIKTGRYYSVTYNKSIGGEESKKYWQVSWIDDDGYANFNTFDNEDDYNTFIEDKN